MVNPKTLVSAIVTKLKAIPDVVTAVGGNANNILSFDDDFPGVTDLQRTIYELKQGMLVVWRSTAPGSRAAEVWTHRFSIILRLPGSYADAFAAIANGAPTGGDGLKFRLTTINAGCDPIGTLNCERQMLMISEQVFLDYFEVTFSIAERGIAA